MGYVQNTRPYLEYCDIFTLTSPLEGFGIVYLEAMLYEKPCLASKNCGSEDVVLNGRTGYSFGITEFKKLTDIISKIIKNKSKRTELGKKGYEHLMQNFTFSKFKSWWWGQLSAIVEPIFAVIGAAFVILVYPILPYALAFAAGAMIFIVVEEVIPESQRGGNTDLATMGLILGFIVMMSLDVALG